MNIWLSRLIKARQVRLEREQPLQPNESNTK